MANTHTIFISHSWNHDNHHTDLQNLLKTRGYFNVEFEEATRNNPIDSKNADYIKQALTKKIRKSNIILGLSGIYASHSGWMEWELDKARSLEIPIIGIAPWGQDRLSSVVTSRSITDVRWNTDSIVNAIRQYSI